jgi:hypothetical protein
VGDGRIVEGGTPRGSLGRREGMRSRGDWVEMLRGAAADANAWTAASKLTNSSEVSDTMRQTNSSENIRRQSSVRINIPADNTLVVVSTPRSRSTPEPISRHMCQDERRIAYRAPEVEDALSDSDGAEMGLLGIVI